MGGRGEEGGRAVRHATLLSGLNTTHASGFNIAGPPLVGCRGRSIQAGGVWGALGVQNGAGAGFAKTRRLEVESWRTAKKGSAVMHIQALCCFGVGSLLSQRLLQLAEFGDPRIDSASTVPWAEAVS